MESFESKTSILEWTNRNSVLRCDFSHRQIFLDINQIFSSFLSTLLTINQSKIWKSKKKIKLGFARITIFFHVAVQLNDNTICN